jgi:GH15 family glucan-1,4-alpha-glucosidase
MYPPDDPRIAGTMEAVREQLTVRSPIGGVARYVDDHYHQVSRDVRNVPGNPWFICSLWLAEWHARVARTADDLRLSLDLLVWACERALPSGVLAEQIDPYTGAPLSASPLTWSHAELVAAVHGYLKARERLASPPQHVEP